MKLTRASRLVAVFLLGGIPSLAWAQPSCSGRGARSALAVTPFADPTMSLRWEQPVTEAGLIQAFGQPRHIDTTLSPSREPNRVDINRRWRFDDVTVEATVGQSEREPQLWVNQVEVRSSSRPLQCGIAVGIPLSRLQAILGPPRPDEQSGDCTDAGRFFWLQEHPEPYTDGYNPWASLCVSSDENGIITRIIWRQESHC
jgi:hypothetical protein